MAQTFPAPEARQLHRLVEGLHPAVPLIASGQQLLTGLKFTQRKIFNPPVVVIVIRRSLYLDMGLYSKPLDINTLIVIDEDRPNPTDILDTAPCSVGLIDGCGNHRTFAVELHKALPTVGEGAVKCLFQGIL